MPVRCRRLRSLLAQHTPGRVWDRLQALRWDGAAAAGTGTNRNPDHLTRAGRVFADHVRRQDEPRGYHSRFIETSSRDYVLEPQVGPLVVRLRECGATAHSDEM